MTVKEIVTNYLTKNGYDGLCNEECGCFLKDELFVCGEVYPDCLAGHEGTAEEGHQIIHALEAKDE
jgi:hypothetical protein